MIDPNKMLANFESEASAYRARLATAENELQRLRSEVEVLKLDAERLEWLQGQHGNLFTPGQSFRDENWAWFGDDGKRLDGSTLRELLDSAITASRSEGK